ncbi:hypothetical protein E3N88_27390 [Mikania micrantha]|uniref:PARP catalytic domain-containing protein n=1 Tax=Mikania micrantha TaxID=192012 RepID=A0A5N6MWI9_9ASTR|nr:hypothetical protein E3N88_27390 [Mikania micrantha]
MLVHHLHPNPIENSPSGYKTRFVSQLHAKMRLHSTTCALTAVESQAARVMHAFCAFIRGNVNCQGKQTDVIPRNARTITLGSRAQRRKLEEDEELTHLHTRNCSPGLNELHNWFLAHLTPPHFVTSVSILPATTHFVASQSPTTQPHVGLPPLVIPYSLLSSLHHRELPKPRPITSPPPVTPPGFNPPTLLDVPCYGSDVINCYRSVNDDSGGTVLAIGDPSRNVIEMIFRSKSTNTPKYSINIKQVLKLNNSKQTLERFEKFRENVKNRVHDHQNKHPRNVVDGNEKLMFYGTKLTHCKNIGTAMLCKDNHICSIIKPDFYVPKKKRGIWLTTSCQDVITANANANAEMTIVVCRVISGRVKDLNDGDEDDYDSIEGAKPNYLFLAARVMHSFCAFLMNCQGKRTDVIRRNARSVMLGSRDQRRKLENDEELTHHHALNYPPGGTVLAIGDPSRNVIEMIFRSKSTNTPKYSINIKQVRKLNNSKQTLERFEKFRENVKNRAHDHQNKHPRNVVDGNEKLMFYGTKLTHCNNIGTSKLCKDNNICSIIKPDFYVPKKKRGIWLTTSCQDVITANANAEMIKGEMTIVVCRVISGRVKDLNDGDEDDYDSIEGVKPNYLFVRDPSAVLPCFVVILKCWKKSKGKKKRSTEGVGTSISKRLRFSKRKAAVQEVSQIKKVMEVDSSLSEEETESDLNVIAKDVTADSILPTDAPGGSAETAKLESSYANALFAPSWGILNNDRFEDPAVALRLVKEIATPGQRLANGALGDEEVRGQMAALWAQMGALLPEINQHWRDFQAMEKDREEEKLHALEVERLYAEKEIFLDEKMTLIKKDLEHGLAVLEESRARFNEEREKFAKEKDDLTRVMTDLQTKNKSLGEHNDLLVADREWLFSQGIQQIVSRLHNSHEFLISLAAVQNAAREYGITLGLKSGYKHAAAGHPLEGLVNYKPHAKARLQEAISTFEGTNFPFLEAVAKCVNEPRQTLQASPSTASFVTPLNVPVAAKPPMKPASSRGASVESSQVSTPDDK